MLHMKKILVGLAIILVSFTALVPAFSLEEIISEETLSAKIYAPKNFKSMIPEIEEEIELSRTKLMNRLGLKEWKEVEVWLLPSVHDYYKLRGEKSRAPEWAAGLSFSDKGIIIIANGVAKGGVVHNVKQTLRHEMAHVAVDRAKKGKAFPRWFHEGFAVWFADEWTPERSERLSRAVSFDRIQKFAEIERSFPSHQHSASLSYDQSFHFVRSLGEDYGTDVYKKLFKALDEKSFDEAFMSATDHSLVFVETKWLAKLKKGQSPWSILNDANILFFGASILFVVAFLIRRRRNKSQLVKMSHQKGWDYDESRYPLPGQSAERSSSEK